MGTDEANKARPNPWQKRSSLGWDDGTASIGWFKRAAKSRALANARAPVADDVMSDDAAAEAAKRWGDDYGNMGWVHDGKRSMSKDSMMRMFSKFRKP